jgi:hypothetical protein
MLMQPSTIKVSDIIDFANQKTIKSNDHHSGDVLSNLTHK